jgi:hypothetical protein
MTASWKIQEYSNGSACELNVHRYLQHYASHLFAGDPHVWISSRLFSVNETTHRFHMWNIPARPDFNLPHLVFEAV